RQPQVLPAARVRARHAGLSVHRPHHALQHARGHQAGLHPHRERQGPPPAGRDGQARDAQHPHPGRHRHRPRPRVVHRRGVPHRVRLQPPRHGALRPDVPPRPRPARDDPAGNLYGHPLHRREPRRRHALRGHRPADQVRLMALATAQTQDPAERGISAWGIAWRRIRRDPGAIVAASVILVLVLVAVFAPQLAPWDPARPDRAVSFRATPPSAEHSLGTDRAGRAVLSRLIFGARVSLAVGFGSQLLSLVFGVVFGLMAGYFGGWIDILISRLIEILQAFPSLLLLIVLSVTIGPGLVTAYIALGIVGWS